MNNSRLESVAALWRLSSLELLWAAISEIDPPLTRVEFNDTTDSDYDRLAAERSASDQAFLFKPRPV